MEDPRTTPEPQADETPAFRGLYRYVKIPVKALDCVIAQHLIYSMVPCVANSKKELDEKFAHTVENIFGEGHVPYSVKAIRETGLGV